MDVFKKDLKVVDFETDFVCEKYGLIFRDLTLCCDSCVTKRRLVCAQVYADVQEFYVDIGFAESVEKLYKSGRPFSSYIFYDYLTDKVIFSCDYDDTDELTEDLVLATPASRIANAVLHSRMNVLLEKGNQYLSVEEYLVAKRGAYKLPYEDVKKYISNVDNVVVAADDKDTLNGVVRCDPELLVKLGIYDSSKEYIWELEYQDDDPVYVEFEYVPKIDYAHFLFGRNHPKSEYNYNIFDEDLKNYLLDLMRRSARDTLSSEDYYRFFDKDIRYYEDLAKEYMNKAAECMNKINELRK